MNTDHIIAHKRRRKTEETNSDIKKKKVEGDDRSSSRVASPAALNNTPSWARMNKCSSLIPSSKSVYGRCPNVSSRYEKLGRIGEGTYGAYLLFLKCHNQIDLTS